MDKNLGVRSEINNGKESVELSLDELECVTGGEYDGPIAYSEIEECAHLLDHIRDEYGLENACCVASRFYWDDTATEIFRNHGGFMWAQYVSAHYNPRQGL